ncbi:MAG TPA: Crp/Fnr family transcriptional regulator [Bacteroidia bacterium]|jgi:CRP-like cAMP-binding protein|nr:Crp/Fnr family transcriptional regulator [Bacteroidia bacterium]
MADFFQFCSKFSELDKPATEELFKDLKTKSFKKGEYILKSGQVCRYLFFINQGFAKSFFIRDDKEFIMRFFAEDFMFSVFDSYITQAPSSYSIIALEDTTVTLISHDKMEELCKKHHCMESFFRKLVSLVTIKMMKRISGMLEENSTERYNQFVIENKAIIQRISLGDLAQYLGITQQSLSRIRAQK